MLTLTNKISDGYGSAADIRHYRGLSTDVTPDGECYKVKRNNGDEIYCMDNGNVFMYDEENGKWIDQANYAKVE